MTMTTTTIEQMDEKATPKPQQQPNKATMRTITEQTDYNNETTRMK